MKKYLYVFFFFCCTPFLYSQTCCSGGVPLSNGIGLGNEDKGTLQLGLNYDYNNLNTLNAGDVKLEDASRLRITHSVLGTIGYNITNRIAVEGMFTWLNQRRLITNFGNENLTATNGVGDAVALGKYTFPDILGKSSSLSLGLGVRIPLGATENTDARGIVLAADLQPGSGAWDTIFWSSIRKSPNFRPSMSFFSRISYRLTGTNETYLEVFDYRFGSELQLYVGASDQYLVLKKLITPSISLKYRSAEQDKIQEAVQESTGGQWIFITPSVVIPIFGETALMVRMELPLYSFVEGTQLTPTYRLTFGLQTKFRLKKEKNFNIIN